MRSKLTRTPLKHPNITKWHRCVPLCRRRRKSGHKTDVAQKAAKSLAARNASLLNRVHLITLGIHILYIVLRSLFARPRFTLPYALLSVPALVIELVFEKQSRPKFQSSSGELKRSGEDLDAPGLTEWMWDILYWTWGCIVIAGALGDSAWWLYAAVPLYTLYLAYTTFGSVRRSMTGVAGAGGESQGYGQEVRSKRQGKMERRGQKVQHI